MTLDLRSTLGLRGVPGEAPGELPVVTGGVYSDTAGHSRRVRCIALALARELGLESGELASVGQAALFAPRVLGPQIALVVLAPAVVAEASANAAQIPTMIRKRRIPPRNPCRSQSCGETN